MTQKYISRIVRCWHEFGYWIQNGLHIIILRQNSIKQHKFCDTVLYYSNVMIIELISYCTSNNHYLAISQGSMQISLVCVRLKIMTSAPAPAWHLPKMWYLCDCKKFRNLHISYLSIRLIISRLHFPHNTLNWEFGARNISNDLKNVNE